MQRLHSAVDSTCTNCVHDVKWVNLVRSESLKTQLDHNAKESCWNDVRRGVESYAWLNVWRGLYICSGGAAYDMIDSILLFAVKFGSYCGQSLPIGNERCRCSAAEHAGIPVLLLLRRALAVLVTVFQEHRSVCKVSDWPMISFLALHLYALVTKGTMIKCLKFVVVVRPNCSLYHCGEQ